MTQNGTMISNGNAKKGEELKIVIVGDGGCGKTSLLMVYAKGDFPEKYAPSVFEKYVTTVTYGGKEIRLNLYDTAVSRVYQEWSTTQRTSSQLDTTVRSIGVNMGQHPCVPNVLYTVFYGFIKTCGIIGFLRSQDDYDRLRPLSYQNANLVLVCYDVTNPTSFENVLIKWYPEVNHFCRDVPVILIGCKTDLRKDKERTRRLKAMDQAPITYTQGEETRRHMSAELYLECSAKYRENVEDIFRDATKKALASSRRARQRTKKRHCVIL
ncbi:unnamed protein product [Oncorhynchus mykiss]|uniref:Rho-related GTP-binding protein RhoF n=1 Tax=Oncorhynchus mykiss TaxID=8022 RepID=A0A060VXK3_ONCMY|nr:unnamed protein product [Oncorhynchus mykiss]